jgi:hypothetical protein
VRLRGDVVSVSGAGADRRGAQERIVAEEIDRLTRRLVGIAGNG